MTFKELKEELGLLSRDFYAVGDEEVMFLEAVADDTDTVQPFLVIEDDWFQFDGLSVPVRVIYSATNDILGQLTKDEDE